MVRTRYILFALVPAAVCLVGACSWRSRADNAIVVSGNIELTEVAVAFKAPGRLVERAVEEGARVAKGAVLGRLDTDQTRRQLEREQAGIRAAEAALVQLETAIRYQKSALEAETELRRAELHQAEARLAEAVTGSRPQEIEQARAGVEEARSQFAQAERDFQRAERLYKNEDISTAQFDQFRARYDTARAALKGAEERLSLVQAGTRKEEIDSARAAVERARAALRLTEAGGLEVKRKEQELAARRAEIERARAQAAVLETQLAESVAVSPIGGIVLVKSAEPGEVLAAGTPFVTVGDLDHPWLRAYIGEKDLGRVKLGAKVRVMTDSYPGKDYWGRVSFISSDAEFTPKQIQTTEERVKLVYRIKIDIANSNHELKSNMPADARILLNE